MRSKILKTGTVLLLSLAFSGISWADQDWSMTLTPQSTGAGPNTTVDFQIMFVNNMTQDLFFSDFGDGQSITVDLEGDVVGDGTCGPGVDCFMQNLFLTSSDPIDILAGSTGTYDLGVLMLGAHPPGARITVVVKGGPDSLPDGTFPDPAFSETSADIVVTPEPSSITLLLIGVFGGGFVARVRRTIVWNTNACL